MSDLWFRPTGLHYSKVHVRGSTAWHFLEIQDGHGGFGLAEIVAQADGRDVLGAAARLADRLRGEALDSDRAVLEHLRLGEDDLVKDRVAASAVSSLRAAVADALARRAQLPLVEYLRMEGGLAGEVPDKVELYANINRSMLPDDYGPADRSPDAFATAAATAVDAGFRTVKCAPFDECRSPFESTGLPPEADTGLERVRMVRQTIGDGVRLFIDCHSRFDIDSAIELGDELGSIGIDWFEEPVDPVRLTEDLLRIRDSVDLPFAGAEHGYGLSLFRSLIESEALDIVMPDVLHCGGPVEAFLIGCELESSNPGSVSLHCPSGPVSLATSAHATAAFGNALPMEHAVNEVDWRAEVLEPRERVVDGYFELNGEPGIGGVLDYSTVFARGERWAP